MSEPTSNQTAREPITPRSVVLFCWSESSRDDGEHRQRIAASLSSESLVPRDIVEFDIEERVGRLSAARSIAAAAFGKETESALAARLLESQLSEIQADVEIVVVFAFDAGAGRIARQWRARGKLSAPIVGWCRQLLVDPVWDGAVDALLVVDEQVKEVAIKHGWEAERLWCVGVGAPDALVAATRRERDQLRSLYALGQGQPLVLVCCDGMDEEALSGTLIQASLLSTPITLLYDVDQNERARTVLRRKASTYGVEAQLFGRVPEGVDFWVLADVLVGVPGPLLEQRSLFLGAPGVVLVDQMGGVAANRYMEAGGAAACTMTTLSAELDRTADPSAFEAAKQRSHKIPRDGHVQIARALREAVKEKSRLLESPIASEAASRKPQPDAAIPNVSPLEPIGGQRQQLSSESRVILSREASERVANHQRELERWQRRADLAKQQEQADLAEEADRRVRHHQAAMHAALAELRGLERETANDKTDAEKKRTLEKNFKQIQIEDDLAAIKRRLGKS
jgi:hypothetical protein